MPRDEPARRVAELPWAERHGRPRRAAEQGGGEHESDGAERAGEEAHVRVGEAWEEGELQ